MSKIKKIINKAASDRRKAERKKRKIQRELSKMKERQKLAQQIEDRKTRESILAGLREEETKKHKEQAIKQSKSIGKVRPGNFNDQKKLMVSIAVKFIDSNKFTEEQKEAMQEDLETINSCDTYEEWMEADMELLNSIYQKVLDKLKK